MSSPRGVRAGRRLGPAEHLRRRKDFSDLHRRGRRGGDRVLRVLVGTNGLDWCRIACAVPKRFGPAVARNRVRRLYKEAFRLEKHRLPPGHDILVSPPRGRGVATLEDVRASLVSCVKKVAARLDRPTRPDPPA